MFAHFFGKEKQTVVCDATPTEQETVSTWSSVSSGPIWQIFITVLFSSLYNLQIQDASVLMTTHSSLPRDWQLLYRQFRKVTKHGGFEPPTACVLDVIVIE